MTFSIRATEICNFADDNTLYKCAESTQEVLESHQSDLDIVLKWFIADQLMVNAAKFLFSTPL